MTSIDELHEVLESRGRLAAAAAPAPAEVRHRARRLRRRQQVARAAAPLALCGLVAIGTVGAIDGRDRGATDLRVELADGSTPAPANDVVRRDLQNGGTLEIGLRTGDPFHEFEWRGERTDCRRTLAIGVHADGSPGRTGATTFVPIDDPSAPEATTTVVLPGLFGPHSDSATDGDTHGRASRVIVAIVNPAAGSTYRLTAYGHVVDEVVADASLLGLNAVRDPGPFDTADRTWLTDPLTLERIDQDGTVTPLAVPAILPTGDPC